MIKKLQEKLKKDGEIYFKVKIRPGAPISSFRAILNENEDNEIVYKLDISAPPVQGRANQELITFLAKNFSTNKNNVKIISGTGTKIKLIKIKYGD